MLCKSWIGLRLAITDEEAEDSAESSTDEEEEAAGEEERSAPLNYISTDLFFFTCVYRIFNLLMFYETWKFNILRYCTF